MLTDGEKIYLSDFELVLDLDFDLDEKEQLFFKENKYYDEGEIFYGLASHLLNRFMGLTDSKKAALLQRYRLGPDELTRLANSLIANVEDIVANGFIALGEDFVDLMVKYRPIINLMHEFNTKMRAGDRKDFVFEHSKLERLLSQVR